ncbi:MAG: NUDIX domain-containing protein [Spirochaetales bacterium]|nr:NUDIX domain-containing protein [Spirochaetales bacterium]
MSPPWNWETWQPKERASLLFLFDSDQILLIHKKRGLGAGKINAPGGRLEANETFEQAAIRETFEETGLQVFQLVETAALKFAFVDGYGLDVRAFFAFKHQGQPRETAEALPFWQKTSEIPWSKMWEDDPLWLKPALLGHYVNGRFVFSGDRMLEYNLELLPRP